MNIHRSRPRPTLVIPHRKHVEFEPPSHLGNLSPDLQPSSPPTFQSEDPSHSISKVGKYLLTEKNQTPDGSKVYQAIHEETLKELICKVIPIDKYRDILSPYWQAGDSHENINEIQEILLGETQAYVFFQRSHGDLHSYIRGKRKLKEGEACQLFEQIVSAVDHCHQNGVILRDVKLRKFVFKDQERTELMLDSLEDAYVLDDDTDDRLTDKHGCPAYVSPEILNTSKFYSGRAADMWSLGVMLYTMLIGRYPFHDPEPSVLFGKIRRGQFNIPDTISSRARCLLRNLLRRDPTERLSAEHTLKHPWFHTHKPVFIHVSTESKDQTVPEYVFNDDDDASFFS